jgi:DNA-binding NarL/FixJ family response regulator
VNGPVRVLLADDHPVVRAGLRAVLEMQPDLVVVAETGSPDEAVRLARETGPDVVLMDLQFDGVMAGAAATAQLAALPDAPRVLVLTTYDTEADILTAIEAGATGYLLKDAPPDELAAAVRAAAAGQTAPAPEVAQRLLDRVRAPGRSLSARELEVLQLVGAGLSNAEISKQLFLSQATVKSHLVHIFTKLDVDSRTAAVAAATEAGLIRRWNSGPSDRKPAGSNGTHRGESVSSVARCLSEWPLISRRARPGSPGSRRSAGSARPPRSSAPRR